MNVRVTQLDWEQILDVMLFYRRKEGYVDMVDGKLLFFDSDPCIDGVGACKITIEEVTRYIDEYKKLRAQEL